MLRILIIKPSSLGDIVHGLQVAASLKEQLPGLQVTWVAREMFAPLVTACECVDEVLVFERRDGWRGIRSMMRTLKTREFDAVLDLQGLFRSGLMTWSARSPMKLGRSDAREGAGIFYDGKAALPPSGRRSHALEILLQFAPLLNARPELPSSLSFREPTGFARGGFFAEGKTPPVVLFPGSRREEKRWPGFVELTRRMFANDPTVRIVWSGGEALEDGAEFSADRFLNLTAKTKLDAMPAVIARAGVVIANDSGPMHLAAALGVRTLAVFGPTDPVLFGPYPLSNPRHHVVRAPEGDLARLSADEVLHAWLALSATGMRMQHS
jgi:lipopolysaccharide heptosyltransferase I